MARNETSITFDQRKYPDAVAPATPQRGNEIRPSEQKITAMAIEISGLPVMFEEYFQDEAELALSPDELLREYGRLAYPPGSCYEYSNIGFAALGAIASSLTGTDFGTLMTQRVLTPLGLHDSFFDTNVSRRPTGAARYDPLGKPIPYYTTSTPASGELYASAHDLARFAMFNMKTHSKDQSRILDDRWIDELHKSVYVGPSGVATTFGWFSAQLGAQRPSNFQEWWPGRCRDYSLHDPEGRARPPGLNEPIRWERTGALCVQPGTRPLLNS